MDAEEREREESKDRDREPRACWLKSDAVGNNVSRRA
jgi:hypothetical protein